MSKKRTKKDKLKTAERRVAQLGQDGQYAFTGNTTTLASKTGGLASTRSATDSIEKLFGYPLGAIYSDLGKTVVVTCVVSCLLAAITWYLRFLN